MLSVFNDLQRTYIQVKKLRSGETSLEIAGLFIVFAEFPGSYKASRTMVLMEDEDVLPTKSLYIFLHECRALFHPSLLGQQRYRSLDPNTWLRLQITKASEPGW